MKKIKYLRRLINGLAAETKLYSVIFYIINVTTSTFSRSSFKYNQDHLWNRYFLEYFGKL